MRALGRRTTPAAPPILSAGDIELDSAKRTVSRRGELIDLTRKEFGVLETLLMAQGAVVSSEELLDRVWDENADPFTTTVRVTMMTLEGSSGNRRSSTPWSAPDTGSTRLPWPPWTKE